MLAPAIFSWIIAPGKRVFIRVPGRNLASFTQVAEAAGEREITKSGGAILFFTDDVVNVVSR